MESKRRKCKLSDSQYREVDLRQYTEIITATINETVPGKNPKVFADYFSTDSLTQSESVAVGRALAKIDALNRYGKTVTTFRLFDGKMYDSETATVPCKRNQNPKGGRIK